MKTKKEKLRKMLTECVLIIIIINLFLSITDACECPIKIKDHVSPIVNTMLDKNNKLIYFYWHCGNVKSISGKCGEWMVSLKTCDGKRLKCYSSYLIVLNHQTTSEKPYIIKPKANYLR